MKKIEHILKILPEYYAAVVSGKKTFEIRQNDRNYQVGDWIKLLEFNGEDFTGNYVNALITYITSYGQKENMVVFSIRPYSFGVHNKESMKRLTSQKPSDKEGLK